MIINDIDCNHKYEYENISERAKLLFRANIENYSGKKITINLNYENLFNDPVFSTFNIDEGGFNFYPKEEDILSLLASDILTKNLSGEVSYNQYNNNTTVGYSFLTDYNIKY